MMRTRLNPLVYVGRCAVEPTVTLYPVNDTMTAFRFQSFRFVNVTSSVLYLHCTSRTCLLSENTGNCDSNCRSPASAGRLRRRVDDIITYDVSSGPVFVVIGAPSVTSLITSLTSSKPALGNNMLNRASIVKGKSLKVLKRSYTDTARSHPIRLKIVSVYIRCQSATIGGIFSGPK